MLGKCAFSWFFFSKDSVSKSELEASEVSISESIETCWDCSDSNPDSSQSANMPKKPKENSFNSGPLTE